MNQTFSLSQYKDWQVRLCKTRETGYILNFMEDSMMGTGIMPFPMPTRYYFRKDDWRCQLEISHGIDHDVEYSPALESINLIEHQMRACH